jgi:hypothetical protein
MNIGVLSKILGHNSIKVTLDSYGTIIDELMLNNVKELKEKLSQQKQLDNSNDRGTLINTQHDPLFLLKKPSLN